MILSIAILFTGDQNENEWYCVYYIICLSNSISPRIGQFGVAALQQIDGSIEEASNILGGDSQYTFRKATLPLSCPPL